ncbi:hypothetical protein SELMODRAFT_412065 [Selaginella moellendorffii]|uniref:Protein YIP n=1 Tax=Selaginella moellendorffii TaxID=88036 RepID=D8RJY4_SELML|nr:protein YIPF5 homolog [Selaginella moellendorffii]EFJ27138.1 hypothetical protein SELMODRAFT_412065 [Selaginella moellendorffii]|eukprot:XP_002971389.1 protein YIPF5 homolog [Selaginella moellendorffii]
MAQRRAPGIPPQQHQQVPFVPQQQPQAPMRPMPPTPGLPFLSFDIGNSGYGGSAPLQQPGYSSSSSASTGFGAAFEDEPPLLEELGINPSQILQKTKSVLIPFRRNLNLHEDADLSGPFLFCILFGLCQLLAGKLHFGVILGWGSLASGFLYTVANLLSGTRGTLDLYRSFSLVGYSLLPMILFSALSLLVPRQGAPIYVMAGLIVLWCTWSCTSLLVVLAPHSEEQKRLIAYACLIIYMAFALLIIF